MPARRVTFQTGEISASSGVLAALNRTGENLDPYIERFLHSDWGLVSEDDSRINNIALLENYGGGPLIGIYQLRDRTEIWFYTEPDRSKTMITLAGE